MIGMVVCLATAALPAAASKKPNPAALALFRKAIQSSNIEAKNGTPFRLQATVRAFGGAGKHADGVAIEFWTPDHKSRTETLFPGYSRIEVRDGWKIRKKKSTQYTPFPLWVVWQAMEFDNDL